MAPAPRLLLRGFALLWLALGLGFLIYPVVWGEYVNLFLPTTTARIHLRASHGGLPLGLGLFFWLAGGRPEWHRAGLALATCLFGGLAAATALAILLAGQTIPRIVAMLGAEVALAGLAAWSLRGSHDSG